MAVPLSADRHPPSSLVGHGSSPRTWPWWLVIVAALGSLALLESGGVELRVPLLRISAHNPRPFAYGAAFIAIAALIWRRQLAWTLDLPALAADVRRGATLWVGGLAIGVAVVSIVWNTWTIGGSDSHCYAAQARAFASGSVHVSEPLAIEAPWPDATRTFAPVGFLPSPSVPGEFLPVCAPGFSLVLAPLVWLWPAAQFWLAPLSAAVVVWAASRLGRAIDDGLGGVASALLAATAPVVLYQAVQPMNDVPTAAAIATAAAFTWSLPQRPAAAGALVGLGLLSRPNQLPIVLPFVLAFAGRTNRRELTAFLAGLVPIAVLVPLLNTLVYGAPLSSGYGDASALFSSRHIATNAANYGRWLLETMSPLAVAALATPWLVRRESPERRRIARDLLLTAVIVAACYIAYVPFAEWWYLRFLLPAIPLLCALMAVAINRLGQVAGPRAGLITMAVVTALAWHGLTGARDREVFRLWRFEQRFSATASYLKSTAPDVAGISVQPNGAIRYELGQPVVSWDSLDPRWLDRTVGWLGSRGYRPLLVIDSSEDEAFRHRFANFSPLGALDWPPRAIVHRAVRIFDPADRARFLAGEHVPTERVTAGTTRRGR